MRFALTLGGSVARRVTTHTVSRMNLGRDGRFVAEIGAHMTSRGAELDSAPGIPIRPVGLPIEENETVFSLLTRFSRIAVYDWATLVGARGAANPHLVRDFPVGLTKYLSVIGADVGDIDAWLRRHTATYYYAEAIRHGERETSIECSSIFPDATLRRVSGGSRNKLRWCPPCAVNERATRGFSWWHRDHQLPLTNTCQAHRGLLEETSIGCIGSLLPHEIAVVEDHRVPTPSEIDLAIAGIEARLATGGGRAGLLDIDWYGREQLSRCAAVEPSLLPSLLRRYSLLLAQPHRDLALSLANNKVRLRTAASWLLGRYPVQADPAQAILVLAILRAWCAESRIRPYYNLPSA